MSAPTCSCTPHPYGDGPEVDCPVHGAVQALNQANAEIERLRAEQKRRRYVIEPDTVEHPKTVGDIRRAIEPLTDDAQMFVAISGHGEDYAVAEVDMSQQVDDAGYLVFGLEIHLGLFPERVDTARAES